VSAEKPTERRGALPAGLEAIALLSRARSFEVWDAWDAGRGCRVIVKAVREDRRGDAGAAARLRAEGELLERLRHPHIVRALEVIDGPEPALVLECLGGSTLAALVEEEEEPLDSAELAHLGLQLVSALAYLHGRGHLHLDLKPSNAIAEAGRVRLIDLGLAAPPGRVEPELGTWSYLAPEQVDGERVGAAADVWGLGATLFDCAAGFPPFDDPAHEKGGASGSASGSASDSGPASYPQLERRARPLATLRPDLDPRLGALVGACLDPDPERRPILAQIAAELEQVAGLPAAERRLSRSVAR
jgi:serine/threonine protein kinase